MNVASLVLTGLENVHASGAEYWLDNHLTYGGSGGPIVNTNGELVGIVCQKLLLPPTPMSGRKNTFWHGHGIIASTNQLDIGYV